MGCQSRRARIKDAFDEAGIEIPFPWHRHANRLAPTTRRWAATDGRPRSIAAGADQAPACAEPKDAPAGRLEAATLTTPNRLPLSVAQRFGLGETERQLAAHPLTRQLPNPQNKRCLGALPLQLLRTTNKPHSTSSLSSV